MLLPARWRRARAASTRKRWKRLKSRVCRASVVAACRPKEPRHSREGPALLLEINTSGEGLCAILACGVASVLCHNTDVITLAPVL